MMWEKLLETKSKYLSVGTILLSNATSPYEEKIEMMLYDNLDSERGMGLICTTGYYSGRIIVHLPIESRFEGKNLSTEWLINNWGHWVMPDTNTNDVFISKGYEVSSLNN